MNSPSVRRLCWSASAALAFLLAVAPVLVAQAGPAGQVSGAKIDLNTASQAELESLPGVDPATAKQIIAGRPYASVADLSKAGVPAGTIERITPLVKVGPLGTAAAATEEAAQKAAAGVGKGADATAKGIEKGVSAASKGVQKGAAATASAAEKVDRKMTGAPREPPQAGMVWADTATKIYHKEGDPSYGKTKKGKWLTEEQAVKEGYRAAKPIALKEKEERQ
ncbi:MAG: helix-hairpin-helix domain-containing protein [Planctomycetes bacterium]|nr:helix-hairpin-helix domain-containing protein [Planctomycetota bacterium]